MHPTISDVHGNIIEKLGNIIGKRGNFPYVRVWKTDVRGNYLEDRANIIGKHDNFPYALRGNIRGMHRNIPDKIGRRCYRTCARLISPQNCRASSSNLFGKSGEGIPGDFAAGACVAPCLRRKIH